LRTRGGREDKGRREYEGMGNREMGRKIRLRGREDEEEEKTRRCR